MTTESVKANLPFMTKKKGYEVFKKYFFAFLVDMFLWAYSLLILYKIIYQKLILNLRYAEFNWSQPQIALTLGAVLATSFFFTKCSIGKAVLKLHKGVENVNHFKMPYSYLSYVILLLTFIAGTLISQVSIHEFLSSNGLQGARRIFGALLTPNFTIFENALFAAIETIYMAFIATAVALPIAFLTSFFAARNLTKDSPLFRTIYAVTRFFLNMSRSIEPLVWAILFSVWVGIGPFSGMLALCIHSVASLAKLYSEQIENIGDGPIEAMKATGAHPIQVIWFGVVPQIILPFLSFTIYRWDINVRMATVIGLVGGGGIGTMLMQYQGLAKWNEVGLLVLVIASIVWAMDYLSSKLREAIK